MKNKLYVCNSCKEIITDAFAVKMKEFHYSGLGCLLLGIKRKKKIRLCGRCFSALKHIAIMKGGAE